MYKGYWEQPQFIVTFGALGITPNNGLSSELAELYIGRLQYLESGGKFNTTICYLASAVVKYDILIDKNTISLPRQPHQGELISVANNTSTAFRDEPTRVSTLDGLSVDMDIFFMADTAVVHARHGNHTLWQPCDYAGGTPTADAYKYQHFKDGWASSNCYWFSDPTEDLIFEFNKYMLRPGALAASCSNVSTLIDPGLSVHQEVTGQTLPFVYKSNLRWFAGAAVLQMATIVLILPMFWG